MSKKLLRSGSGAMDHWLENFDDYLYALQGAFD